MSMKGRFCLPILLVLVVSASVCAIPAHAQTPKTRTAIQWLDYEPAVVELRGTLVVRTFFGPPNYGENPKTDSKEQQLILLLGSPVNVRGQVGDDVTVNASVRNARRVTLVPNENYPSKKFVGRRVIVKGTLFHAHTGHHHTEILIMVQSMRLAEAKARGR